MNTKRIKINGEKASYADIHSAASLATYTHNDYSYEQKKSMSIDIFRAIQYNELLQLNLIKRAIGYAKQSTAENREENENIKKALVDKGIILPKESVFIQKNPQNAFRFMKDILSKKREGYSENIISILANCFQNHLRN